MKRVRVNKGKVALVTQKGNFSRILRAGSYFVSFASKVKLFSETVLYRSDDSLQVFMQEAGFKNEIEILDVADGQVAVRFDNGHFVSVLNSGVYFYFKGIADFRFEILDLDQYQVPKGLNVSLLQKMELRPYVSVYEVQPYEAGLLLVEGELVEKLKPGVYRYIKGSTKVEVLKVDMRSQQMELSGQEILTADKASLRMNFYANYQVVDAEKALLNSKAYERQLYVMLQFALREYIGNLTLDEVLESKTKISDYVLSTVGAKLESLGVVLLESGIRDVILPGDMKEIMNQVLIAQKKAQASVISRREETASTRSQLNTAKLMENNDMLFRLKEMEYVERIAEKIGQLELSGNGQILEQLKTVFSKTKT